MLTIIVFITLSKNIRRKSCIMSTKVNQNEKIYNERKEFDATKKFFEQFIDLHANFKIYKNKKK